MSHYQKNIARKAIFKLKISWLSNKQKELKRSCLLNSIKFYYKGKSVKNKKGRKRYLIRKKNKLNEITVKNTSEIVLNKSCLVLNSYDIELLSYGPQFIPKPKWESKVVQIEKEKFLKTHKNNWMERCFMNKDENDGINQNYKLQYKQKANRS